MANPQCEPIQMTKIEKLFTTKHWRINTIFHILLVEASFGSSFALSFESE